MASREMSRQGVWQEVTKENGAGTIRRKPVPIGSVDPTLEIRLGSLSVSTTLDSQADFLSSPTTTFSATSGDEFIGFEPNDDGATGKPSILKTAFEEARHFAGGLISHPYESTKHYSILRHSHGLVYFKGFSTNIAITVFADRVLPADRQFWLQKKGFSGKTGLKVGAMMGTKSAWINITPTVDATADQLPPTDERAWQRDIEKFLRKAPKELRYHELRETNIIRIPFEAQDGYFRIVLCTGEKGKKVLCPSPVFRLASTSTSSSSLRGSSLSTMPVELGIKIGQYAAKTAALKGIAPVTSAVTSSVKQMLPYQSSELAEKATETVYDASDVRRTFDHVNSQYQQSRQLSIEQLLAAGPREMVGRDVIGEDDGPEAPFPIQFTSNVIPGTGHSRATLGMPTANLADAPEEIRLHLSGVYIGWASIDPSQNLNVPSELVSNWQIALITIAPRPDRVASVVPVKEARVYLLANFGPYNFLSATLSILLMAPLRPLQPLTGADIESRLLMITQDVAIAQNSLSRPNWGAEDTLHRISTAKSSRSLTERLVDVRREGQKQVDRVGLHKAGIRTGGMGLKDRAVGNGGVCVRR